MEALERPAAPLGRAGVQLALDVILESFGPIVKAASVALTKMEWATLSDVIDRVRQLQDTGPVAPGLRVDDNGLQETPLPPVTPQYVRDALMVLLQHNMLGVRTPTEDEARRTGGPFYALQIPAVLSRLRAQRSIRRAHERYGIRGAEIARLLWRHGRLCVAAIIDDAVMNLLGPADTADAQAEEKRRAERLQVQRAFKTMVRDRYITRVKPLELTAPYVLPDYFKPPPSKAAAARASRGGRGGRGGRGAGGTAKGAAAAAAAGSLKRKRPAPPSVVPEIPRMVAGALPVEMQMMLDAGEEEGARIDKLNSSEGENHWVDGTPPPPPAKAQRSAAGKKAATQASSSNGVGGSSSGGSSRTNVNGKNRAAGGGGSSGGGRAAAGEEGGCSAMDGSAVWAVNLVQFNRDWRHEQYLKYVVTKASNSLFVKAAFGRILELSMPLEREAADASSQALPFARIEEQISHLKLQFPSEHHRLKTWLSYLEVDTVGSLSQSTQGGIHRVTLKFTNVMNELRVRTIQDMLADRYGPMYSRVWKVLLVKGRLEHQDVAQEALMPIKDCRALLYRLYRDHFVTLEEFPRRSDNPNGGSNTFYFSVNTRQYTETAIEVLHESILRARRACRAIAETNRDLLERGRRSKWPEYDDEDEPSDASPTSPSETARAQNGAASDGDAAKDAVEEKQRERFMAVSNNLRRLEVAEVLLDDNLALFDSY